MTTRRPLREIPFEQIEDDFELARLDVWERSPAVGARKDGGFYIRVIKTRTITRGSVHETYDYFYLDPDGTVTAAPRGYARDYKPGRITGLDEAVAKYALPTAGAS